MQNARFFRSLRYALPLAAALSFGGTASAAGVAPKAATHAQRDQAQSRFLRGKELYGAGRFDAALAEFSASFDIVASPNTRLYIARCLRELGRLVPAYNEFGRAETEAKELAKEDKRYDKAASAAADERRQLESQLGFVNVSIAHPASNTTLKVAGEEVPRDAWSRPVAVAPGNADVVVETPGEPPVQRSVQVAAGQKESVAIDAEQKTEAPVAAKTETPVHADTGSDRSGLRPYAYVAGGVALAGLAAFTVFGLLSNGTYSDLKSECGDKACPPGHEDEISRGKSQQTIANIGLAVFAIGAAVGVTLFVVGSPSKSSTGAASRTRVVMRGSYLGLEGSF